jgi:hypothetical protein
LLRNLGRNALSGKWASAIRAPARQTKGLRRILRILHQVHPHNQYTDFLLRNGKKELLAGNRDGHKAQYANDLIADDASIS